MYNRYLHILWFVRDDSLSIHLITSHHIHNKMGIESPNLRPSIESKIPWAPEALGFQYFLRYVYEFYFALNLRNQNINKIQSPCPKNFIPILYIIYVIPFEFLWNFNFL